MKLQRQVDLLKKNSLNNLNYKTSVTMQKILLIILSIFTCVLSSCTQQTEEYTPPVFPIEKTIKASVSSDDTELAYPYGICVDNKYIYVLALMDYYWIHV